MSHAKYATVHGFKTVRIMGNIVEAVKDSGATLTGLIVDVSTEYKPGWSDVPGDNWQRLDTIEMGYDRVRVQTTDQEDCWMYVAK